MDPRIHDHAIIGNTRSAALVARDGSLDWLCWPRFDSPPVFARLVDPTGGEWRIAPTLKAGVTRRYVGHTNVLETTFTTATGRAVLVDLMTVAGEDTKRIELVPDDELLRHVRCEEGEVEFEAVIAPRPDFGQARVRCRQHRQLGVRWEVGNELLALRADVPLVVADDIARATFRLRAGETATFSFTRDDGPALLAPLGAPALDRIARSLAWWQTWANRARYTGPYRDCVLRSALTVKLMAFAPSGAIVAAPTTSLPERPGGKLNWDYRYCWVRDAAFTTRALLSLGYEEEAIAFTSWLAHATRLTHPEIRVLYDVYGRSPQREREITTAAGYRGARPVRVGNAADQQLQLDCYGEVIDAIAHLARAIDGISKATQSMLHELGEYVLRAWRLPDQGIWEPRGHPEHRTHSRLLCWVALDRLCDLAKRGLLVGVDGDRLAGEAAAIRRDIEDHGYDAARGCYTGAFGNPDLDASVLLLSWYGFHPAKAPRMQSTYEHIRKGLGAGPGLFYRYDDSVRSGEGAFWICSFWAVELLACAGMRDQARALMDAARSYANDVGLMAEEIDPATGDGLGNFPQAYTHVGLINAALSLEEAP
jgi:GH15 family glucan-1,4-alpha-glucosidase